MKKLTSILLAVLMLLTVTPLRGAVAEEPVELDIFINESWWPIDTFTGIIPEAIQAATGVKLNVTVCTDDNQLGLMIASNDLPDLIFTQKELNRLSDEKVCYSYDELLEQYPSEFQFGDQQKAIGRSLSADGKYYCVLNCYNTAEEWASAPIAPGQACMFYRKDLYEAIGSPKLENLDDFLTVCGMIQEKYPDIIPFELGGFWKLQNFSAWTGAAGNNTYQQLDDGSVVYASSSPAYKDFLTYANTLARKGYITVESYANEDEANSSAIAYGGKCFAYCWYLKPDACLDVLNAESQKIDPSIEWTVLPALGGEHAEFGTSKGWCGTFVSKKCKDPEAATRLITFLFSEEGRRLSKWGREGVEYTMDENNMPVWTDEWMEATKDSNLMNQKYNQYFYLGASNIEDLLPGYVGLDAENLAAFSTYKQGYKMYPEIGIAVPVSTSDEGIIETKLTEMLKPQVAKVIFSETDEEFEKNYEELQSKATQIGVEKLNAYMTENVKKIRDEFGF